MKSQEKELKRLDTDALLELRDQVEQILNLRRQSLEAQLERIASQPKVRILPRYRSKKDPAVTWSGRGVLPKWMRAEMTGTELRKEDFRIG